VSEFIKKKEPPPSTNSSQKKANDIGNCAEAPDNGNRRAEIGVEQGEEDDNQIQMFKERLDIISKRQSLRR
jgi:hypothetical protein